MTVVTFTGYAPSARHDNEPWTEARIQESANGTSGWTTVETMSLTPVDSDPSMPQIRDFTSVLGTLDTGYYRIVWADANGNTELGDSVQWPRSQDIRPAIADIGALLHARTYYGGVQLGTFTNATTPNATQVASLIDAATNDLRARLGYGIPDHHAEDAQQLVALQTASLIEASFFPDQLDTDRSAYRQYQAMYLNGVEALRGKTAGSGLMGTVGLSTSVTEQSDATFGGDDQEDAGRWTLIG